MRCACEELFRLDGNEAVAYAREHLRETSVDPVAWTIHYVCDATGRRWLRDYPYSHLHGGGPPRLRQLDENGKPVEDNGTDPYR